MNKKPDFIEIPKTDLVDVFEAREGSINFYYGRIGSGKTYNATADILELLSWGHVVYCNWRINWEGFDERKSFIHAFFKTLFGRKVFFYLPKENLRYFSQDDSETWRVGEKKFTDFIDFLNALTDCDIFIDEGQWVLDSYEGNKFSVGKRRLLLHTRHVNRSINIISQRTQAVQVSARGQVNRFFKCETRMRWPFLIFRRIEFQDMKDNDVDESVEPISVKTYFANKRVMEAYDTKYLRAGIPKSQEVYFKAFVYSFKGKLKLLGGFLPRFDISRLRSLERAKRNIGHKGLDKQHTTQHRDTHKGAIHHELHESN